MAHHLAEMKIPTMTLACPDRAGLGGKTLLLIRHAEGQHNVADTFDFDPPLTAEGHEQVQQTSLALGDLLRTVELVVVSPLRRTLQTATGLFPGPKLPIFVALDSIREVVESPCNLRCQREESQAHFPNVDFSRVSEGSDPMLSRFSDVGSGEPVRRKKRGKQSAPCDPSTPSGFPSHPDPAGLYCTQGETDTEIGARIVGFLDWVSHRDEQRIAVVSHARFLVPLCRALWSDQGKGDGWTGVNRQVHRDIFANCEVREVVISAAQL